MPRPPSAPSLPPALAARTVAPAAESPNTRAEIAAQLATLVENASLCGQALEAASVGAADPQLRALLLHRATLQRHAATDLTSRAQRLTESLPLTSTQAALAARFNRRPSAPAAMRDRASDTPLQLAARRAARSVTACGAILRADLGDSSLRPLLMRYYHEAADLVRVLEQIVRRQQPPSRRAGTRQRYGAGERVGR